MKTILFQGDSITDLGRPTENDDYLGAGYVTIAAGELAYQNPGEFKFINRGISGNRVVDLYARWKADCWNLKPDYLSILVGCNDAAFELHFENGVDAKRFENIYDLMLCETMERLPDCKIMLLEPFLMKYLHTQEKWEPYRAEVNLRGEVVRKLADKHGLVFVPLQEKFDEYVLKSHVSEWTPDGVHPSAAGSTIIAHEWLKAFKENFMK